MTLDSNSNKPVEEKKKKKRCPVCNKKLGLMDYTCRCGNTYCLKHRMPEEHQCSFDFQKLGKDILDRKNPQVVADKLVKI